LITSDLVVTILATRQQVVIGNHSALIVELLDPRPHPLTPSRRAALRAPLRDDAGCGRGK